jgi:hypothetical protein
MIEKIDEYAPLLEGIENNQVTLKTLLEYYKAKFLFSYKLTEQLQKIMKIFPKLDEPEQLAFPIYLTINYNVKYGTAMPDADFSVMMEQIINQ